MKQISLATAGFQLVTKRTRKRVFLDEMNWVVPWAELVALIAPFAPSTGDKGGRPPFAVETMLRIHFLQQWFGLSDPAMEGAAPRLAMNAVPAVLFLWFRRRFVMPQAEQPLWTWMSLG